MPGKLELVRAGRGLSIVETRVQARKVQRKLMVDLSSLRPIFEIPEQCPAYPEILRPPRSLGAV